MKQHNILVDKKSVTKYPKVSVVIPMRNSETTIVQALQTIQRQHYPVKEIIIIDNASSDRSVSRARDTMNESNLPYRIIERRRNQGVGSSYNLGIRLARQKHVVFLHSDSALPTAYELQKLARPFQDAGVVATYPHAVLPEDAWEKFTFWVKYLFARSVGEEIGFNGKFDCIRKDAFQKIGGFDENNFARDEFIGGEDADLYLRLNKIGTIALSDARVLHLHYLGSHFSFYELMSRRRMLARTYGRLVKLHGTSLPLTTHGLGLTIPLGMILFFVRPALGLIVFLPGMLYTGLLLLFLFAFLYSRRMYITLSSYKNFRIFLLPLVDIFFVYYESFWMIETLLFRKSEYNNLDV